MPTQSLTLGSDLLGNRSSMLHFIAAGTYFEQGGLRNKTRGGWSLDKSDARHYDPKAQFL